MVQEDRDYLLARAAQERGLAEQASDEVARVIQEELAHEYEVRANIREIASKADSDVIGRAVAPATFPCRPINFLAIVAD